METKGIKNSFLSLKLVVPTTGRGQALLSVYDCHSMNFDSRKVEIIENSAKDWKNLQTCFPKSNCL